MIEYTIGINPATLSSELEAVPMGIMVVRCSPFSWDVIEKMDNWSSILAASQAAIAKITFSITLTFVFWKFQDPRINKIKPDIPINEAAKTIP